MHEREYEERLKPMLWAMFASASLMRGNDVDNAAAVGDSMVKQFEKRFPVELDPDE